MYIKLAEIKALVPFASKLIDFIELLLRRGRKINLNNHPIFVRASLHKTNVKVYFTLPNKGKEVVFKDILCQHLDIYYRYAKSICERYLSNEIDSSETLYNESVKALDSILSDLRTFYIADERYTQGEKIVLDIVMSKYNHWNQDRQGDMVNRMYEICNSAFYPTLNNKIVAILDAFMFAMSDTVSDANKTLNNINGDLKGLIFKGVEI